MIAGSQLRQRPAPLQLLLLLGGGGLVSLVFIGIPVLGALWPFPVRLEFYVALIIFVAGCGICFLVGSRRPPGTPVTWGEAIVAATFVFGVMLVGYGVVPNEWMKWADIQLLWRPDRIAAALSAKSPFVHFGQKAAVEAAAGRGRITITYQAIRDIIVATIYIVLLGLQAGLWIAYQKRGRKAPEAAVERTSTYGRPLVKV